MAPKHHIRSLADRLVEARSEGERLKAVEEEGRRTEGWAPASGVGKAGNPLPGYEAVVVHGISPRCSAMVTTVGDWYWRKVSDIRCLTIQIPRSSVKDPCGKCKGCGKAIQIE